MGGRGQVTFAVTGGSFRPRAKFFAAFRRDAETTYRQYVEKTYW